MAMSQSACFLPKRSHLWDGSKHWEALNHGIVDVENLLRPTEFRENPFTLAMIYDIYLIVFQENPTLDILNWFMLIYDIYLIASPRISHSITIVGG